MIPVDETRCIKCKREFEGRTVVKWGTIGFDLRHYLPPSLVDEAGILTRVEAPVCGRCFEVFASDISDISIHPGDLPLISARKPLERLPSTSGEILTSIAGIPVVVDDTVEPGRVELRYEQKRIPQPRDVDCDHG